MDYKFIVGEEETITFDFPWRFDNFLLLLWGKWWHVINELPGVFRIWYNETKLEFVVPENTPSEVVSLNHLHLLNRLCSNSKIEGEPHCLQLEEVWAEVILDDASAWVIFFAWLVVNVLLWNIH